jgi:hypothetical protein
MKEMFYEKLLNNKVITLVYIFCLINIYIIFGIPKNNIFLLTNLIILSLSFFSFYYSPHQFSLIKIVYIFTFVFFGVIPLNDINNNNIYWGANQGVDIYEMILSNIILILGLLFFIVGSRVTLNINKVVIKIFAR